MSDAVSVQKILDDRRNLVVKCTNLSDGTGENNVRKVDVSTLNPPNPGLHMKLWRIQYDISGMAVRVQWEGTPNSDILVLGGLGSQISDFGDWGGIPNNSNGVGNVSFTTVNATAGDSYSIIMYFKKGI